MKITKFAIALALFVTSVSFEQQVLTTKNGVDSNWSLSITTNQSYAVMMEAAASAY